MLDKIVAWVGIAFALSAIGAVIVAKTVRFAVREKPEEPKCEN